MSMPPQISTELIANNTLQSQKVPTGQIETYFRGYQESYDLPEKPYSVIEFDYYDPNILEFIPGVYYNFGMYDFDTCQNPLEQEDFTWEHFGNANSVAHYGLLDERYGELANGLAIMDGTISQPNYFYHKLNENELELIRETGIGEVEFTIGFTKDAIFRNSPYNFAPISNIIANYFTNGSFGISNFISIGAHSSDPNYRFRFILNFTLKYNTNQTDTIVYFAPATISHISQVPTSIHTLIPDWNGLTFKTFKFKYEPVRIATNIIGKLYAINSDNTETLIVQNISPVHAAASFPYATEFGSYSSEGRGNMIIKKLNYNAYVASQYKIARNKILYNTVADFLAYFKDKYKFRITGSNTSNCIVDWSWINKQSTTIIEENTDQEITISDDFFDPTNLNYYNYLQDAKKTNRIYVTNEDSIKNLYLDKEFLTNINLTGCNGIKNIILTNSSITRLDLSNNINLTGVFFNIKNQSLNLRHQNQLEFLKLPINFNEKNVLLDIRGRNYKPEVLAFENNSSNRKKFCLCIDQEQVNNVKLLSLRNITFTINPSDIEDIPTDWANYIDSNIKPIYNFDWPSVELIDISYSNIISNKTYLESFLNHLPDRTGQSIGFIFMYGDKFTYNGIKGNMSDIADQLENIRNKNWLFYA